MRMGGEQETEVRRIPHLIRTGLILSLVLSLGVLALYVLGSAPEGVFPALSGGFSDATQFLLLRILWYLSLFLSLFSFCALAFSVRLIIRRPRLRYALNIGLCLLTGVLGLGLALLNSLIVAIAGGNG